MATVLPRGRPARLLVAVAALACLWGVLAAARLAWVCDDAFISFRYARNLVRGLGLVFNADERVEGYTNFLWTLLMAGGLRLGLDPVPLAEGLGLACYAALLALALRFWLRGRPGDGSGATAAGLPVTALGLALLHHLQVFATGGLETMLFTLLVYAGLTGAAAGRHARGQAVAGLLLALATLTRPDGALFYACAAAFAAADAACARRWRPLGALLAPGVALVLPVLAWRWTYYGDLLPNTWYAKAAGHAQFGEGLAYVGLFLRRYWMLALAPFALAALAAAARGAPARRRRIASPDAADARAVALAAVAVTVYGGWVVQVGGDFMYARLLVPLAPLLLLPLELATRLLIAPRWRLPAGAALAAAAALTVAPADLHDIDHGVVEERDFYPAARIVEARAAGARLRDLLAGTEPRVVIFGSQAMLAYYADFPLVIEGHAGLTDAYIAHLPAPATGRAGHLKQAPMDYLWRRGVQFAFGFGLYNPPHAGLFNEIDFAGIPGWIYSYDRAVMDRLATRPGIRFTRAQDYIDAHLTLTSPAPPAGLRLEYELLRRYYFERNDDPGREQALRAAAGIR
jgi:hypothetical protein